MNDVQYFVKSLKSVGFLMDLELILVIKEYSKLSPHICVLQHRDIPTNIIVLVERLFVESDKGTNKWLQLARTSILCRFILIANLLESPTCCWELPKSLQAYVNKAVQVAVSVESAKLSDKKRSS